MTIKVKAIPISRIVREQLKRAVRDRYDVEVMLLIDKARPIADKLYLSLFTQKQLNALRTINKMPKIRAADYSITRAARGGRYFPLYLSKDQPWPWMAYSTTIELKNPAIYVRPAIMNEVKIAKLLEPILVQFDTLKPIAQLDYGR